MTSQPEKFFREKLEHFQKPAPAAAWDKIEAGLDKPSNKLVWLRISAGIVLLSVAVFLLWPAETSSPETLSEAAKPVVEEPIADQPEIHVPEQQTAAVTKNESERKQGIRKITEPETPHTLVAEVVAREQEIATPQIENESLATENTVTTPVEEVASITITYSADEVNARFLKKDAKADATPVENKSSGIQKLIGLAYDVKNDNNAFGDLRQKKNEILALNFRENKREEN